MPTLQFTGVTLLLNLIGHWYESCNLLLFYVWLVLIKNLFIVGLVAMNQSKSRRVLCLVLRVIWMLDHPDSCRHFTQHLSRYHQLLLVYSLILFKLIWLLKVEINCLYYNYGIYNWDTYSWRRPFIKVSKALLPINGDRAGWKGSIRVTDPSFKFV